MDICNLNTTLKWVSWSGRMQPRAITQVLFLCTNLMYKSCMVYQRMEQPCCQVSIMLLLHQLARVMRPALSKKIVHAMVLSISENITPLSIFLYSAELASVPEHLWALDSLHNAPSCGLYLELEGTCMVCVVNPARGKALSKQQLSHWIVAVISLVHRGLLPRAMRAHSTRAIANVPETLLQDHTCLVLQVRCDNSSSRSSLCHVCCVSVSVLEVLLYFTLWLLSESRTNICYCVGCELSEREWNVK